MAAVNVLIAFYSRNGSTEALAKAVEGAQAQGARSQNAEGSRDRRSGNHGQGSGLAGECEKDEQAVRRSD